MPADTRANPFGDLDDFKPAQARKPVERKAIEELSEQSGFVSREPAVARQPERIDLPLSSVAVEPMPLRRYRTGRTAQVNIRAKPETVAVFNQLADRLDLTLVQVFEMAVAALEREVKSGNPVR